MSIMGAFNRPHSVLWRRLVATVTSVLLLMLSARDGSAARKVVGKVLPSKFVSRTETLDGEGGVCDCWQACRGSPQCLAVTATLTLGPFAVLECQYSSRLVLSTSLLPFVDPSLLSVSNDSNSVSRSNGSLVNNTSSESADQNLTEVASFIKECGGVFDGVEGAGCYFFSPHLATYYRAKDSCPGESVLATPSAKAIYDSLVTHILKPDHDYASKQWWVDIMKVGNVWTWGNGVPALTPYGSWPWSLGAPNDGSLNARMRLADYLLDDRSGTTQYHFICQQTGPAM